MNPHFLFEVGLNCRMIGPPSRALGPAKENIYALESLDGYIVWGC